MPLRKNKLEEVLEPALLAFWGEVAKAFPQATTGDLDAVLRAQMERAAERALLNWIDNNIADAHLHFNYDLQVWVRFGLVQDCGHPEGMSKTLGKRVISYCCNQKRYAGWPIGKAIENFHKKNTTSTQGSITT